MKIIFYGTHTYYILKVFANICRGEIDFCEDEVGDDGMEFIEADARRIISALLDLDPSARLTNPEDIKGTDHHPFC